MIVRLLIVLNIIGFLWEIRVAGPRAFSNLPNGTPVDAGLLVPYYVLHDHQYYRIFSAAFLHGGIWHIGLNMLSLYWIGRFVELVLRPWRTLIVYVFAIIVSGLSVIYLSPPFAGTLGASGAIFGLFGAIFAIGLKLGERGRDLVRSSVPWLILNLVWSFSSGISWQAHIGGLIAGFVLTYVIFYPPRPVMTRVYDPSTGAQYESSVEMPDDRT